MPDLDQVTEAKLAKRRKPRPKCAVPARASVPDLADGTRRNISFISHPDNAHRFSEDALLEAFAIES